MLVALLVLSSVALCACASAIPTSLLNPASPREASAGCGQLTQPAVRSLDTLRSRLLTPIHYRAFIRRLRAVRTIIRRLPLSDMTLACLRGTATRLQGVFNEYSYSANAWTECIVDPHCDLVANEPVVERKWWVAGRLLSELHREEDVGS